MCRCSVPLSGAAADVKEVRQQVSESRSRAVAAMQAVAMEWLSGVAADVKEVRKQVSETRIRAVGTMQTVALECESQVRTVTAEGAAFAVAAASVPCCLGPNSW